MDLKECEIVDMDIAVNKNTIFASASSLGVFEGCPGQTYSQKIIKEEVKDVVWPGTLFGSIIHKMIENSIEAKHKGLNNKEIGKLLKDLFILYFNKMWAESREFFKESRGYKEEDFIKKGDKYSKLIIVFILKYIDQFDKAFSEKKFRAFYFDKDVICTGYIDLLNILDKEFLVYDFKTTKDPHKFFFVDFNQNIQCLMYLYLIWKTQNKFPTEFSFIVLDHVNNMLFFKTTKIKKPEDIPAYFDKYLSPKIDALIEFYKNPGWHLNKPEKTKCHWCKSYLCLDKKKNMIDKDFKKLKTFDKKYFRSDKYIVKSFIAWFSTYDNKNVKFEKDNKIDFEKETICKISFKEIKKFSMTIEYCNKDEDKIIKASF